MTPATSLAEELGKAGQALKTLLSTSPPDDDSSELWHLRRIAMHSPASLTSAPPVLFHSSAEAMDSVLYGADEPQCDDAAFKEGLWCPPSDAVAVGVCMCEVNSPTSMALPAVLLATKLEEKVTITLFCPDAPLASLEHELFDANLAPSAVQRYMLGAEAAEEEHKRRTWAARRKMTESGLQRLPEFLVSGAYHLRRRTALPFLRVRRATTEEEVALLRRLPSKLNVGARKQDPTFLDDAARATSKSDYTFEVVFQAHNAPFSDSTHRFNELAKTPILTPLVDILMFKSMPPSAPSSVTLPGEEEKFRWFLSDLRNRELQQANGKLQTTTQKHQLSNLATLDALTRTGAQCFRYGSSARLISAVNHLFGDEDAKVLEAQFEEGKNATCKDDLRTLSMLLSPDQLVLFTELDDNGLIRSTTCCGANVYGMQINLDSLARLCMLPYVVHLVQAQGSISQRFPETAKQRKLTLTRGVGASATMHASVTPALNVSRVDFDRLLTKMDDVRELLDRKRPRENGDGDGDDGDDDDDGGAAATAAAAAADATAAAAESSIAALETAAKVAMEAAIAQITEKACAAAGAAAVTAAAGTVAAQKLPPSPAAAPAAAPAVAPVVLPSGVAALDVALKAMRTTDAKLKHRMRALLAA